MANQYALAYTNLMNDLIKQKSAEEAPSTSFMAGIASARQHGIEADKDRIMKMGQFLNQQSQFLEQQRIRKEEREEKKQFMADSLPESKKLSDAIDAFGPVHGFVKETREILSRPGAEEDFQLLKKIYAGAQGKNWLERQVDDYVFGYNPKEAKSDTEKMSKLLEYRIRQTQDPEELKKLTSAEKLWTDIGRTLKNLSGMEVKQIGQQSQAAHYMFISSLLQRFMKSDDAKDFMDNGITGSLRPIAEELKSKAEELKKTEAGLGIESSASRKYDEKRDVIESYFKGDTEGPIDGIAVYPPRAKESRDKGDDLGEAIQKDIQEGKKDGTVTEVFNSDKMEMPNSNNNDEDLLKGYSEEGRKKVMDYAQKNKMTVKQVFEEFSE